MNTKPLAKPNSFHSTPFEGCNKQPSALDCASVPKMANNSDRFRRVFSWFSNIPLCKLKIPPNPNFTWRADDTKSPMVMVSLLKFKIYFMPCLHWIKIVQTLIRSLNCHGRDGSVSSPSNLKKQRTNKVHKLWRPNKFVHGITNCVIGSLFSKTPQTAIKIFQCYVCLFREP